MDLGTFSQEIKNTTLGTALCQNSPIFHRVLRTNFTVTSIDAHFYFEIAHKCFVCPSPPHQEGLIITLKSPYFRITVATITLKISAAP